MLITSAGSVCAPRCYLISMGTMSMAQLHYSPLAGHYSLATNSRQSIFVDISFRSNKALPKLKSEANISLRKHPGQTKFLQLFAVGGGGGVSSGHGGNSGDGGGWNKGDSSDESNFSWDAFAPIGAFLNGWRSRVAADPQFPFKVLMEELVGVSACVLGDMLSRPNFGLNELDFVFSTLVVNSILNFVLMYLLAPTLSASPQTLPSIFASCPTSHMFEPGAYSLMSRFGTFIYKGTVFAAVGFSAGLVGTAISNGLIKMRKKMDPNFKTPNKSPPTILNAATWALHVGLSSNFRYQTLNGIEFLLAKGFPPVLFKSSVVVLRCLNNVLGGVSFVVLARLTGSQSVSQSKASIDESYLFEQKQKLLNEADNSTSIEPLSAPK